MKTHKRRARGETFSGKQLARVAVLLLPALFLGWLCVKAATVEALGRRNPGVVASLAPADPRLAFSLANREFRLRQGAVTAPTTQRAVLALQNAPLASEPFLYKGIARLVAGDQASARVLIGEARRRAPRSRTARLLYLDQVLRAGQVQQAAAEIATISRLVPESWRVLVPELARYAADPSTAPALINALRHDPQMRDGVLLHMASKGADADAIIRLAQSGPASVPGGQTSAWQALLLTRLVEKGEVGRARRLWAEFSGLRESELGDGLYNGEFRPAAGPPPFNWQFVEAPAGVAEPIKGPALQVEYYGRVEAELASQLLQLQPGRHRLSFSAQGNTPASGGSLAWTVTCLRGKQPLAAVPIRQLSYTAKRIAAEFVVPPACGAQWLRLIGSTAEFPATHSVTISNLQILKAPGS